MTLTTSWWPPDTGEPVLETTLGAVLRDAAARAPDYPALIEGRLQDMIIRGGENVYLSGSGRVQKFVLGDHLADDAIAPLATLTSSPSGTRGER